MSIKILVTLYNFEKVEKIIYFSLYKTCGHIFYLNMNTLKISIKKSEIIAFVADVCYLVCACVFIADSISHSDSVLYLIGSLLFFVSAFLMIIKTIYLICKLHIKEIKNLASESNSSSPENISEIDIEANTNDNNNVINIDNSHNIETVYNTTS